MFRKLCRGDQEIPREECIAILKEETCGVLSVAGEMGYPYGMPMNHYYCEIDGKLYFHCGHGGHREDALRENDKASFCIMDAGHRPEGAWARRVRSVIVFGRITIVDDINLVRRIVTDLSHKFTHDEEYITREMDAAAHKTRMLCMSIDHICGKRVVEE